MTWSTFSFDDLTPYQIEAWRGLHAKDAILRSPFTTYEFCKAVQKIRGRVFVSILENRGEIQAIFPFRRPYSLLPGIGEKPGGHLSDYFGIIGSNHLTLNEQAVLKGAGLSVFSFDHLPLQESMLPLHRGTVTYGIKVEVPDFSEYIEQLRNTNKKLVKQVERLSKQLIDRYGELRFDWQSDSPLVELEKLTSEKRNQYINSGAHDALAPAWARNLLAELIDANDGNCLAILSTLYCGDTWVASNLALRNAETLHIWFPVFNPQLRRYGPGHILFFKLFESAAERGVQVFDFGGGTSAYKKKYSGTEYPLFKGSLRRGNLLSVVHQMGQSANWRIQPFLNR
jgi:CelD/BcsL family acetyltransferase involved in cellulose biosynthesis